MKPSKKNKTGKEELLAKYTSGNITKDEMHLLNLYALEDDFLFEALEGLSDLENENRDSLLDLEKRLSSKKKKKRNPFIYWMSAAAAIAILIIGISVLNPLQKEITESGIAMEQGSEKMKKAREDIANEMENEFSDQKEESSDASITFQSKNKANKPSISAIPNSKTTNKILPSKETAGSELRSKSIQDAEIEVENEEAEFSAIGLIKSEDVSAADPEPAAAILSEENITTQDLALENDISTESPIASSARFKSKSRKIQSDSEIDKPFIITGNISTRAGEPLIGSTIYSPEYNISAITNFDGNFDLQLPGKPKELNAQYLGYEEMVISNIGDEKLDIVLEPSDEAIDVIFVYDEAKAQKDSTDLVEFETYARYNVRMPLQFMEQGSSGYVELEFMVNKKGTASNINVLDSLGYGADEEAVRLIESYNDWNGESKVRKAKKKLKLYFKRKK